MKLTKKIARKFIFPSLMGLSIDKLIRMSSSNSILNIMYHGVVEKDTNFFSPRNLHHEQFEQQLIYLKKNFNIVRLKDAFEMIEHKSRPKRKTITISFDDGLVNNLHMALPLLEKHEIPATFFISSVCVENMDLRCLWAEKIAALKYFYPHETIKVGNYTFNNYMEIHQQKGIETIIKNCHHDERDALLEELVEKYDLINKMNEIPEEAWRLMNKEQLIQFASSKYVDIGSHGHLHYNLGIIDKNKAIEDLKKSKTLLEQTIGKEVDMIAYPDGSYNQSIKDAAEKYGFKYQLAVNYLLDNDKNDRRILNRHGISSRTTFASNMIFLNLAFSKKGIKI